MYRRGDPHWESLVEVFDRYRLHQEGVTGASYYDAREFMMIGMEEGGDRPWCCEYEKKIFIDAWNKVERMVKYWHELDEMVVVPSDLVVSSLIYRSEY